MGKYYSEKDLNKNYQTPVMEEEVVERIKATVANCNKLNVREFAAITAKVITVVEVGTVFEAEVMPANPEWIKVKSELTGNKWCYVMSKYVDVKVN